ncbi:uncharacterized protein K460DRAFT_42125 [Cucurbitaria berberidis CBS 394.84]|uniref:Uncharacterized protein n=1 Tax=Cucurbitaria berberidis CBS 394.84 TaxID=1168544 RepID=A0A9P4LDF6_9PLEO|nr:uncharacterized protein K460DRAFT_42125 [Cucurbitaria berberidis CBS 394.84]KAF1851826.1 hypothetical protein K460DRAFT_42125 [Cucurbitaria berberidis CBS 394.84]
MASALEPLHETLDETVEKLEERMTGSLSGFNNELLKAGEECTEKHKRQSQKLEALETRVEKAEQGLNIEASPQDVIRRIKNIDERITDITTRQTTVDILGQDNAKLLRRTITRDDAHMLLDPVREDIKNTKDTMRTTRVVFDLRLKAVEDAKETVKATQTEFDHRLNAVEDAKETMRATQTEFDERLNAEGQNRENLRCDLTLKMGTHRIETDSKITKRFDEFEGKNIVPLRTDITKLQSTTKLHDEKILELSKDRLRRAAETPTLESVNELQVSHNGLSDNVAKVKADVLQVDGKVTALQESFDKHALQVSSHHNQLERLEEAILKKVDPPSETAKSPAHSSPTQTSSTQSSCNHTREQKIYWSYEAGKRNVEHLKCHQKKIQKIKAKTEVQREIIDGWDERIMKVQADLEKKYDERIKEMKEQHDVEKAAMSARLDGALATMQSMASDIRALKDDQQPMPAMVTDLRRQIEQEVEVRQHKTELLDSRVDEVSGVALAIRDVLFPELRQELEDRVQTVLTTTQQDSQHNIDTGKQALEDLRTEVKGQIDEVTSRSSLAEASLESRIEKRADAIEEKTTGVLDVLGQRVTDLEGATKAAEMVAEASSATLAAVKERMTDLESASEASKAAIEALSAAFDLLNGLVADLESATKAAPSAFAAKLAKTEQFKSLQNEVDTLTSNRETNDTDLRNIRRRLERIEANPQPVLGEYVTSAQFNGLQSWCRTQFSGTKADLKKDMKQRVHSIEQDVERVKKEVEQTKQEVEQVKHQVDNDASAYTTVRFLGAMRRYSANSRTACQQISTTCKPSNNGCLSLATNKLEPTDGI